ncbi:amino acid ABC transporter permease [Pectobacteriaceae bacterium CE70]|uniref:Amino acid ABC transporter permease n=1 Tax=Serratia sp. (strain ATCC 39006) TaxID=104623 RepID=A0A2I5T4J6_SERS3|nr:amino acid ABC transporter permease [Serratia sp. ATCC 39006]WJV61919.1 amino acid ABC transporter permease [Pectobacteriaceae bacterium C52]WJV66191.1 amino acid ABC transporter permease [Pectobacteriaceae bacterium CE70]WJY10200.1 amino acid ABC transporter permease [Pectobacteriaceae bacterium C80]AUG99492.1 amino acid ABC transporter permease [Serratia sp. ATCC 39006]AUH03810.1 amino acid ABC transporter permease [Serratia sp. ATCC 39006]
MNYQWNFGSVWQHREMFLTGIIGTAQLAALSVGIGIVVGCIVAVMRLSPKKYLNAPATVFVEFYRNTPPLVHFFWFFYALPMVAGINLSPYWAATIALATQSGAFYAEVFRGGIKSVDKGQWEGAKAIGMSHFRTMFRVIVPQAARRMAGPFIERTFELTKTTSLASTLAYSDILYQAMRVNSMTFRPLEVYTTVALIYFVSLLMLSTLFRIAEHRLVRY